MERQLEDSKKEEKGVVGIMKEDKQIVINYFKTRFIEARHYPKVKLGKKPDFKLYIRNKLFAHCELKTIINYEFSGKQDDPAWNKIQKKIHEASKQFNDSNPKHNIPNILIFINHDNFTDVKDLWYVLTGNVWPGTDAFDFRYLNRLKKGNDLSTIDYFIWIDKCINRIFYINNSPAFKESFKSKISSKPYEPYNI